MTDWRKSQDGYHAYVGPYFARVRELPQSHPLAGHLQASIRWSKYFGEGRVKRVKSYDEGVRWCDAQIDERVEEIKRDRRKKNTLREAAPHSEHTRVYGPEDMR